MEAGVVGSHQYKRGLWSEEEDKILMEYVEVHGKGKWNHIAKKTGLKRSGKSCRLRWLNHLSPNVKKGNFTEEEDDLIIRLHKLLGNRWSLIAGRVPGRTDNQVKNYWNTHLSRRNGCKKTQSDTSNPETNSETIIVAAEENADQENTIVENNSNPTGHVASFSHIADSFLADGQNFGSSPVWRDQQELQMSIYESLMQFSDEFVQFDFWLEQHDLTFL